ncbi:serine hydrolase [Bosea sp. (in: a-proteobacteria)]|jgi:CubicO group peptidase (beta-lactamase class C family)|uniref:serine hydrolase domain-containing protein n=1 Tax=Bosea sp. (in: a-proteobacteria) TaxID=1871050 RepID=UPI002DDD2CAA|nr:serine hydrolase [Bosea sp. (in: a-proteobacteria)]HEV2510360.1 serine hydrolase [Bosea sp. (in: a-proteobacteria)]
MTQPSAAQAAGDPSWFEQAAPEDEGFSPGIGARLDQAIADGKVWNLHGLVVLRNGKAVLERYFGGEDRARGVGALGHVVFTPDTLHDLRSCSKSIVGLLYGIALQQGQVPPPEAPLFSAFPEHADLAYRDGRDRLLIQHVLTMAMGTDWDESSFPYSDPRNSEIAMDAAPDRYRYILERPVIDVPGAHWAYCGGTTALLAGIIARGTGKTLHDFARESLFGPLGMGATEWVTDGDGEPIAASGVRMSTRDLARIGMMMLNGGQVNGRSVVPAEWLARCVTPFVSADELRRYGYQWFVLDIAFGKPKGWAVGRLERMWMAQGEGGQRLFVIPALDLVIAVTAGNYEREDQWMPPTRVLREIVLAQLR